MRSIRAIGEPSNPAAAHTAAITVLQRALDGSTLTPSPRAVAALAPMATLKKTYRLLAFSGAGGPL